MDFEAALDLAFERAPDDIAAGLPVQPDGVDIGQQLVGDPEHDPGFELLLGTAARPCSTFWHFECVHLYSLIGHLNSCISIHIEAQGLIEAASFKGERQ